MSTGPERLERYRVQDQPPPAGVWLPILSPGPNAPLIVTVLSERPVALLTHWVGAREVVCTAVDGACVCLQTGCATRWSAFLGAWCARPGRAALVRVTEGAARNCPTDHFRDKRLSWRGWLVRLSRTMPKRNSPLRIELRAPSDLLALLPDDPDVPSALLALFHLRARPELV